VVSSLFLLGRLHEWLTPALALSYLGLACWLSAREGRVRQTDPSPRAGECGQRTQAEDALRASEERFHQLAEAMPQIVWTVEEDGSKAYLNCQWKAYTGLEGVSAEEKQAVIHPEDRVAMEKVWEEARSAGTPFQAEFRLKRATDGVYR
jgi:PAS domain S-box-containing protein